MGTWAFGCQNNALCHAHLLSLQWCHNERDDLSNHQPHDCLLNGLFRCRSKKTSQLRVTGLYEGNSPVTGEFPAQRASNAENVSIWWRHHVIIMCGGSRLSITGGHTVIKFAIISIKVTQHACLERSKEIVALRRKPRIAARELCDHVTWKHFAHYWYFVMWIRRSSVDSPHEGAATWRFYVSFVVTLKKLLNDITITWRRYSATWYPPIPPMLATDFL